MGDCSYSMILGVLSVQVACENIRFSSLFADGDVSREERGETDVFVGYSLGYVAGFFIFRKKIIADNGLPNVYSLVEYVLLILEFTI